MKLWARGTVWLALLGALAAAPARGWAGETRVAAVDVSTVFKSYRKVYDVQRQIDAGFEQEKRALQDQQRKLEDFAQEVARDRQQLPGDSELLFDRVQRLQKEQFLLEKKVQDLNRRIEKRYLEEMRDVLSEIRAAIRKEGERGGFHLVLRAPDAEDPIYGKEPEPSAKGEAAETDKAVRELLTPRHTWDLVARFRRNPVLFGAAAVDITDQVVKLLNGEYGKRAGAKAAPETK
jgi:Skp family chaperone for outer membrane proteins